MNFILIIFLAIASGLTFAKPVMLTPRHKAKVDVSKRTLEFKWKGTPETLYRLEIFYKLKSRPDRKFFTNGNSFKVKFRKVPPFLYWRVVPASEKIGKKGRVFQVHLYEKSELIISGFGGITSSKISLDSNDVNKSASVSGPLFEMHADYSPSYWKQKYSFAFHARKASLSGGGDKLDEQRFGAEAGLHLRTGVSSTHIIYLGYHFINRLDFTFDDVNATYDVNFLTTRYFFRKPVSENWEFEMGAGVQFPFPYTFKPSIVLKPLMGYRPRPDWRIDGFILYEKYVSEPKEDGSGDKVDIEIQNLGFGVGLTYRL